MKWIWTSESLPERNRAVRFRTQFSWTEGPANLRITADSRYHLYVNGTVLGFGPVRSWPNHWKFDDYDLTPYLRPGVNVIAVLVRHFQTGNFQYIAAEPGLAAELRGAKGKILPLRWAASPSAAFAAKAPRISVQLAFEEQFDARLEEDWKLPGFSAKGWKEAVTVKAPHAKLEPRGIPFLTREEVLPMRVVTCENLKPLTQTWTLPLRPYYLNEEQSRNSNVSFVKGYLVTFIRAGRAETVEFIRPHRHSHPFKVNGKTVAALDPGFAAPVGAQRIHLKKGWNDVLIPITNFLPGSSSEDAGGSTHLSEFVLGVRTKQALTWASSPRGTGKHDAEAPWVFAGPFAFTDREREEIARQMDFPRVAQPDQFHPEATAEAFTAAWSQGKVGELAAAPYARPVAAEDTVTVNVFAEAVGDVETGSGRLEGAEALVSAGGDIAVIHPAGKGEDVRVLLDFGREVVGMHAFELEAEAGTIIDFHNFEFIQPDGRHNLTEGMNNSFRYICRDGWQSFESVERRGFQYSWMIVRNLRKPVRVRKLVALFSTYPQQNRGSFACSDEKLNRIWQVGAHTMRCCAEDTYTDCPTYEQTHWVGDARNEALVDWVVNGDPRLWFRCLEQTGQSLERFPITGSEVPSSWENILPAWSFLWMRSCREYLLWTGDFEGAAKLFAFIEKNVEGIRAHLNEQGLFTMHAWNLFDWAAMDTPTQGVVTHNNCFIVLALNECAQLADWLKKKSVGTDFRKLAETVAAAINAHLWDKKQRAYIDCIHANDRRSDVFSQQTQTVALSSGVAKGARAKRCREIVHNPPAGFVKAGSPFFEFFLLEALAEEGREKEFLDTIRRDWGFMIEQGATTFWEMWSIKGGRLTRSHCHGWSAAPTFFLSSTVLGIEPLAPGCREIRFDPRMGDLDFVRGEVPTPFGNIRVNCKREGKRVEAQIELPKGVKLQE